MAASVGRAERGEAPVVVDQDDGRGGRGHQRGQAQLEEPAGQGRGAVDVAPLVGGALAHVEHGMGHRPAHQGAEGGGGDGRAHRAAGSVGCSSFCSAGMTSRANRRMLRSASSHGMPA